jgi:hypothetical protein
MRRAAGMAAAFVLAFGGGFATPGQAAAFDLGGWQFNAATGHYYAQVDGTTWFGAEAVASGHGGHLVTINDEAEQDWLSATFTQDNLFIGFNDRAEEGVWVWTSAEPVTYTNWTPGEPNDWQEWFPGEDVAVMNWRDEGGHLGWNDLNEGEPGFVSSIIEMESPFPLNDNLADAIVVMESPFIDQVDMTGATFEDGEATPCATGPSMDGSVWYRFTNPAALVDSIQIDGIAGAVTAAVYGPFEAKPGVPAELGDPTWCVFDPGADSALTEVLGRGTWLVQLTTDSSVETAPSITITWQPAYFWINNDSILVTSATVQRDGMLTIIGTADCVLMTAMPWGDDYPAANWDWTGDNEGYYWYDMQGWARQSLGRKTLLTGGGWGRVDCTNNVWTYQALADNGRFGPNASTIWFQMGEWREDGFYGIADHYEYLKVTKAR